MHFGPRLLAFAAPEDDLRGVVRQDPPGIRADAGFPRGAAPHCGVPSVLPGVPSPPEAEALRASPVSTPMRRAGSREVVGSGCGSSRTCARPSTRLPGRGFEQAASVLGKNYAGTLGVWAPYRCFKEATLQIQPSAAPCHELLETATRGAGASHAWSSSGSPRCANSRSARVRWTPPGMTACARRFTNLPTSEFLDRADVATIPPNKTFASPWSTARWYRGSILMSVLQIAGIRDRDRRWTTPPPER